MKTRTPLFRIAALFALALLATFSATHEAKAQTNAFTNATYTFGANGNTNSFAYNGSNVANLTEGNMLKSSGITTASSSDNFRATGWTTGSSLDTSDYIGFTLTADSGWTLNMTNMTFGIGRSATGTRAWSWYYSTNSFSSSVILTNYTTLASGLTNTAGVLSHADANSGWTGNVLSLSSLTNLGTVEFRLYSWLAEASSGTAGLQGPLSFSGAMVANEAPPAGESLFWTANGSSLGGAGTWDTTGTNWSASDTSVSGAVWDGAKTAVFTNAADTVTVGTVSANAGIKFSTTGYTLSSGTLTLGGSAIASNTITTDTGVTATINSVLSGSAGMTKAGAGTLVLGGANGYTGGTLISAGALQGDTTSLQGTITNTGSIVFNQSTNGAYGSVLSGTGTLIKIGASTLTLSGANCFTGATTISNGAVRLANATASGTTAGGISVANGAALELTGDIAVGAEALSLAGSGISSGGALRSVSGSNSSSRSITRSAPASKSSARLTWPVVTATARAEMARAARTSLAVSPTTMTSRS